jgi:hypothetical protein
MKSKILIISGILILSFSNQVQSQWIQSITVTPPNPTTTDNISILTDGMFPSGSCDEHTQTLSINGNAIYASSLHCLGMLTVICNDVDTFDLGQLAAGSYTFYFQLDAGALPSPCTPGINPGPNDSITFIVSPTVDVPEYISTDAVSVYPNPFNNQFQLNGIDADAYPLQMEIFSAEGKLVKNISVTTNNATISVAELPAAVYQVRVRKSNGEQLIIPAVKK